MFGMRSSLYMIAGSKTSSPAKVTATPAAYRASEAYATFPPIRFCGGLAAG
jgi:hypothetical protein